MELWRWTNNVKAAFLQISSDHNRANRDLSDIRDVSNTRCFFFLLQRSTVHTQHTVRRQYHTISKRTNLTVIYKTKTSLKWKIFLNQNKQGPTELPSCPESPDVKRSSSDAKMSTCWWQGSGTLLWSWGRHGTVPTWWRWRSYCWSSGLLSSPYTCDWKQKMSWNC